jgi:hypothetical protein
LIAQIKKLSFQAENISKNTGGMVRLRSITPEGEVILTRVGEIDHVWVKLISGGYLIVLIADEDTKWYTSFIPASNGYKFDDELKEEPPGNFEIDDQYYIATFFDAMRENCPSIIKVGKMNYVTVAPDNRNLSPIDKWDDWHWHRYTYRGAPNGKSESDDIYYPPPFSPDPDEIHYSMSPWTAFHDHIIVSRRIDQLIRGYYPANLGVVDLPLPSPGSADNPSTLSFYGRGNYSKDSDGKILPYAERVAVSGSLDYPTKLVTFFWPFIPYLDELGHFNILEYNRDSFELNCEIGMFYQWRLFPGDLPLYSDSADFPTVETPSNTSTVENDTICLNYGNICGTGTINETIQTSTSPYRASGIKYIPFGSIGNQKTCYVKNEWVAAGQGSHSHSYVANTSGNFPVTYIALGITWDLWPPLFKVCSYANVSSATVNESDSATRNISLTQQLMFGEDVIDTGISTMDYSYGGTYETNYEGSWAISLTGCDWCNNVQISYTTAQMEVSQQQTLTATSDSVETNDYQWSTDNGTVDPTTGPYTQFTAPASNADCAGNATVTLKCKDSEGNFNVVDTLTIAINAVTASNVGKLCVITNKGSCFVIYSPPGVVYSRQWINMQGKRYAVACDGTVTLSGTYDAGWIPCACEETDTEPCDIASNFVLASLGCASWDTWCDNRSSAQKSAGCCPAQVLGQPAC